MRLWLWVPCLLPSAQSSKWRCLARAKLVAPPIDDGGELCAGDERGNDWPCWAPDTGCAAAAAADQN